MKGILVTIPNFKIPEGHTCKFSNGETCPLFRWSSDKEKNSCLGYRRKNLGGVAKHLECLSNCRIQEERKEKA